MQEIKIEYRNTLMKAITYKVRQVLPYFESMVKSPRIIFMILREQFRERIPTQIVVLLRNHNVMNGYESWLLFSDYFLCLSLSICKQWHVFLIARNLCFKCLALGSAFIK